MKNSNLEMLSKHETYKIIDSRFDTIMRGSLYSRCKSLLEKDRSIDTDDLKQNAWLALTTAANKQNRDLTQIWPLTAFAIETFRRRLSISIRDRFYVKKRNAFVDSLDSRINSDSNLTLYDKISSETSTQISDIYYDYLRILDSNYCIIYNIKSHKVKIEKDYISYSDFDIAISLSEYLYDKCFLEERELMKKYSNGSFKLNKKIYNAINYAISKLIKE